MTEKPEDDAAPLPITPNTIRLMGDGVVASDDPNWVGQTIPAGSVFYSEEWCNELLKGKDRLIRTLMNQLAGDEGKPCAETQDEEVQEIDEAKNLNVMRRMFGQMLIEMPVGAVLDAMCISLSYLNIRDIHAVFSAVGVDLKAEIGDGKP